MGLNCALGLSKRKMEKGMSANDGIPTTNHMADKIFHPTFLGILFLYDKYKVLCQV